VIAGIAVIARNRKGKTFETRRNGGRGGSEKDRVINTLPLINSDDTDGKGKTFTAETRRRGEEPEIYRGTTLIDADQEKDRVIARDRVIG